MKVLKTVNDPVYKSSDKFIGVYVDDATDERLTLLSVQQGVSRSSLLRRFIVDTLTSIDVIAGVADRLFKLSQLKGEPWTEAPLYLFWQNAEEELRKKGVKEDTIQLIYKKFNELIRNEAKSTNTAKGKK